MRSPWTIFMPFAILVAIIIGVCVVYTSYNNFFVRIPETHKDVKELKVKLAEVQKTLDEIVKRLK